MRWSMIVSLSCCAYEQSGKGTLGPRVSTMATYRVKAFFMHDNEAAAAKLAEQAAP